MTSNTVFKVVHDKIANNCSNLCFHRLTVRGVVQEYIISFDKEESDIYIVLSKTYDLFEQLMEHYKTNFVKARLIAQVNYLRMNDKQEVIDDEDYHFASYRSQEVNDNYEFYSRHLFKIGRVWTNSMNMEVV